MSNINSRQSNIEFIPAICPSCGGELRVPDNRDIVKCMYCGKDVILHHDRNIKSAMEFGAAFTNAYAGRGRVYLERGNYDQAISEYTKILELDSNNKLAYVQRANANYAKGGDLEKVIADCNKALSIDPDIVLALLLRGNAYTCLGKYEDALNDIDHALLVDSFNAKGYSSKASIYFSKDNLEGAINYCTQAIEIDNDELNAWRIRGNAYLNRGQYYQAKSDAIVALQKDRNNVWNYFIKILAEVGLDEFDGASDEFVTLKKVLPSDPVIPVIESFLDLINCSFELKEYLLKIKIDNPAILPPSEIASEQLKKVLEHIPRNTNTECLFPIIHYYWGKACYETNYVNQSIAEFNESIKLNPFYSSAYLERAKAYHRIGNDIQALSDINHVIKTGYGLAEAYYERGVINNENKDYDIAIEDFSKAIHISPQYTLAYLDRSSSYRNKGEDGLALLDLSRVLELDNKYLSAYVERYRIFSKKGEYDKAIAELNIAIQIDSKNANLYYYRSRCNINQHKYDLVIYDLSKGIELDPQDYFAYIWRGLCYRFKGDYDRAIADCVIATKLDPRKPDAFTELGIIYLQLGEFKKSIEYCNKAIEVNPDNLYPYGVRGESYFRTGRYNEALSDFDIAISQDNIGEWVLYRCFLVHYVTKNIDKARIDLNRAIEVAEKLHKKFPGDWRLVMNLGLFYLALGDYGKAEAYYKNAVDQNAPLHNLRMGEDECRELEEISKNRKISTIRRLLSRKIKSLELTNRISNKVRVGNRL